MGEITLDQQIAAVKREINMRQNVFDRRVAAKHMSREKADYEIAAMQAVLKTLEGVKASERLL